MENKIIICTSSFTAKNTFFYIHDTGMFENKTPVSVSRCDIECYLFGAVKCGEGELVYNEKIYRLSEGDCFFIDYRIPHICQSNEDNPMNIIWVRFSGATSGEYYKYFLSSSENAFHPACFEQITSAINGIIYSNEQNTPNHEILTSGLIVEILTVSLLVGNTQNTLDSALKQKLININNYIENNFAEDMSLETLSEKFYISKYYLAREYKKLYKRTIFQHIINCRINYGKKLLRFSDKSIDEISHLCGFNDQSYFARLFKKAENVTCFAYRKMWRD